ncbi:MAG: TetR/AcrR family transcriptional regulator [Anaerolineales bacterium]
MTKSNPPKRKYDSTRRQAQAEETRRQILVAAHKLFMERGYAGATIEAIATEAGVAPETIYAVFKNKKKILVNLINFLSATRAEEKTPLLQRAGPQAVAQERDQRRQLQMFAQIVANNLEGAAPISEIILVAAKTERDVDKIMRQLIKQRWQHMTVAVQQLASNGPFREKMDEAYATDIVWTLTSPEVFLLLTRDLGWPKEKYVQWLAETLARVLLP